MARQSLSSLPQVCKTHIVRCDNGSTPLTIMSLTPALFPRQVAALRVGMAEMNLIIARAAAQEVSRG
ncbi:MAG: hypothetical protein EOM37_12555 [Proteobacteria bacterium]|nr:hypothetical protein [Pseudomonadota bacterium]